MLGNDRMETASTELTSNWRRKETEKSTWKTHRYFNDFEKRIHVEISTLSRCYNFHMDLPFKIDEISTKFTRGISTSNRWVIDEDVSIGVLPGIFDCHFLYLVILICHFDNFLIWKCFKVFALPALWFNLI